MRVLAVAQVADLTQVEIQRRGQRGCGPAEAGGRINLIKRAGNGRVVLPRVREGLSREVEPEIQAGTAVPIQLLEHRWVIVRGHDDEDVLEVLGRRPHETRPADINLLDERIERG